jgi:hypothetical protein
MKARLGDRPASTRIVSGPADSGEHRCRSCGRVLEESTRSRLGEVPANMIELRCPANCMTKLTARGPRSRSGNSMAGAGKRVLKWI